MNRGAVSQSLVRTINRAIPGVSAKAHDIRKIRESLAWAQEISSSLNYKCFGLLRVPL